MHFEDKVRMKLKYVLVHTTGHIGSSPRPGCNFAIYFILVRVLEKNNNKSRHSRSGLLRRDCAVDGSQQGGCRSLEYRFAEISQSFSLLRAGIFGV